MIRMASYILLPFLLLTTPMSGQEPPAGAACWREAQPIDLAVAREGFEQAERLAERDGGRLWGVDLSGPMLFADRATRAVVANMVDPVGHLSEHEGVSPLSVGVIRRCQKGAPS